MLFCVLLHCTRIAMPRCQSLLPVQTLQLYVLTTFLSCAILEDKIGHDKKVVTAQQTAAAAAVATLHAGAGCLCMLFC
jgi:hypothetical protein